MSPELNITETFRQARGFSLNPFSTTRVQLTARSSATEEAEGLHRLWSKPHTKLTKRLLVLHESHERILYKNSITKDHATKKGFGGTKKTT